jgi:hypothetical protein
MPISQRWTELWLRGGITGFLRADLGIAACRVVTDRDVTPGVEIEAISDFSFGDYLATWVF